MLTAGVQMPLARTISLLHAHRGFSIDDSFFFYLNVLDSIQFEVSTKVHKIFRHRLEGINLSARSDSPR